MSDHANEFSIKLMGRAFGVSRSGYYARMAQGGLSKREQADKVLTGQIQTIFTNSAATYGSPRVYAEWQAQAIECSRHRIARLMRQSGVSAAHMRRRIKTTQPGTAPTSPVNLLARDFSADAPNRKWFVDITAIATGEGTLYLAGVLDLFSRRLVGWSMDEHMPDELTQEAREMAIVQRTT